jgi:hypothetical protein
MGQAGQGRRPRYQGASGRGGVRGDHLSEADGEGKEVEVVQLIGCLAGTWSPCEEYDKFVEESSACGLPVLMAYARLETYPVDKRVPSTVVRSIPVQHQHVRRRYQAVLPVDNCMPPRALPPSCLVSARRLSRAASTAKHQQLRHVLSLSWLRRVPWWCYGILLNSLKRGGPGQQQVLHSIVAAQPGAQQRLLLVYIAIII